jgi:uncharacterized alkaline shock family protein YloU
MPLRPSAGRSAVTRRAIADIVLASVRGSYGVVGFATPRIGGHLVRLLRLGEPGIRVRIDDGILVELHLRVAHGLPVAEVARQVDSAVRYALRRDLGRQVVRITVHIDGLDDGPARIPEPVTIESAAIDPEPAPDGPATDTDVDVDTLSQRIGGAA